MWVPVQQAMGLLQTVRQHERFVRKEFHGRALGDKFALIEDYNARAQINHKLEIMRGDELGTREGLKKRLEFASATWVQVAAWLIENQHGGLARKHAG